MAEKQIVVRDRRKPHHFTVDNVILDDYLPLVGPIGMAMYSLYCRMASFRDEKSYPGYVMIQGHLGISSGTVANYNRLLVWCELIHIEPGDPTRNEANDYYILDPKPVTADLLNAIYQNAQQHYSDDQFFLTALLERVRSWRPLQSWWPTPKEKPEVIKAHYGERGTHRNERGTHVGERGTHVGEYSTHDGEGGTHVGRVQQKPINKTNQQEVINKNQPTKRTGLVGYILTRLDVKEPLYSKILEGYTGEEIHTLATAWWVKTDTWSKKPAGLFISRLELAAPSGFYDLAQRFIEFSSDDLLMLKQMATKGEKYIEEWLNWQDDANYAGAASAAYAIYQADKTWLADELLEAINVGD